VIGLDASIMKNAFLNVLKNWQKILGAHLNILCLPTKFCREKTLSMTYVEKKKKKTFSMTYVKRQNIYVHVTSNFGVPKFIFFAQVTKNVLFS
jgi:hypothetical protein